MRCIREKNVQLCSALSDFVLHVTVTALPLPHPTAIVCREVQTDPTLQIEALVLLSHREQRIWTTQSAISQASLHKAWYARDEQR
jgi:hypothetical protein